MSIKDPVARTLPLSEAQLAVITAASRQHQEAGLCRVGLLLRPDDRPGERDLDLLVAVNALQPTGLVDAA